MYNTNIVTVKSQTVSFNLVHIVVFILREDHFQQIPLNYNDRMITSPTV